MSDEDQGRQSALVDKRPRTWEALALPRLEVGVAKDVEFDTNHFVGRRVKANELFRLEYDRLRKLITCGADLNEFYRRSTDTDILLLEQQVMHLHFWRCGADVLVYLIQYPRHVLLLGVDTHIHLEDYPRGKRFNPIGRRRFEKNLFDAVAELKAKVATSLFGRQSLGVADEP